MRTITTTDSREIVVLRRFLRSTPRAEQSVAEFFFSDTTPSDTSYTIPDDNLEGKPTWQVIRPVHPFASGSMGPAIEFNISWSQRGVRPLS